jgi:hypothetical protein
MRFSLKPWDVDRLTIVEFEFFAAVIDETIKQSQAAEREQAREAKGLTRPRKR